MRILPTIRFARVACSLAVWLCGGFTWFGYVQAEEGQPSAEQLAFFEKQVRPILVERCQSCHGAKKQEMGLRLDSRAGLLAGSDIGDVVVPGKPGESSLVAAINHAGDINMPPKAKLADPQIAAVTKWVEMGAPWPESSGSDVEVPLTGDELYQHARDNLWSLQPLAPGPLPKVANSSWALQPVDRFILARLEAAGLTPSPLADRRRLIRRATFDLLGLPPSPEEVDAFVADTSPDAYSRLIDRLLASPAYGERWGRHWLDVARYADTKGYAFGRERRFAYAYTYRDWVIAALNRDLPYDEFVIQQIAADHLPEGDPSRLAALGFLTVGRKHNNIHDDIDDQIDAVTRGFLGLTVACARCHDHKYDAIETADYYSLYGVFASTEEPGEGPLLGDPAKTPGYAAYKAELDKRIQKFENFQQSEYDKLVDVARRHVADYLVRVVTKKPEELLQKLPFISLSGEELKPRLVDRWRKYLADNANAEDRIWKPLALLRDVPDGQFESRVVALNEQWKDAGHDDLHPLVKEALATQPPKSKVQLARRFGELFSGVYVAWRDAGGDEGAKETLTPQQRQLLDVLLLEGTPTDLPRGDLHAYLTRDARNNYRKLEKAVDSQRATGTGAPPRAMSVVDRERLHNPRIFIRGNHARRGDPVKRQFLKLVAGEDRQPFTQGSGRLELAEAIAHESRDLAARVIVNRMWMHHFGKPLVATPSDFGMRSSPPSHPRLLDYLAQRLIESQWSLKQLHREMMLSATYQQTSTDRPEARAKDAENLLLWRMNRRRLALEPLRDAMLTVSDSLDQAMYGRPVEAYTNHAIRRRSVYAYIDRQDLPNLLRAFDFASPDQSTPARSKTTVPQQALFMMNSPLVINQAKAVAGRPSIQTAEGAEAKVAALYRTLFQRSPTEAEVTTASEFVQSANASRAGADKLAGIEQLAQLLMMSNEFLFVD